MANQAELAVRHSNRVRQEPWIGVGTSGSWDDIDEALRDTGLDFLVSSMDSYIDTLNQSSQSFVTMINKKVVPGIKVNVRDDTDEIVGVVSDRYGIVQNKHAFSLLKPFLKIGGEIIQGGMTAQGMCFMVCKMKHAVIQQQDFDFYVCAMNSFNAKFPLAVFVTPIRVICQNMFRGLMKNNDNVLHIKHGANSIYRITEAFNATDVITDYINGFNDKVARSMAVPMQIDMLVEDLFPYPNPNVVKNMQASIQKVDETRSMFIDEYVNKPDNQKYIGTGYGFLNAYFDYMTHRPEVRMDADDWNDRRLSGLISGQDINKRLVAKAS